MSLPSVPPSKKKGRFREWREKRAMGEAINQEDVMKIVALNRVLRKDGMNLGIPQVSIEIVPRKYKQLASATDQGYRIKGDGLITVPSSISFDYRLVDRLNEEELRSLAWHELGHYIFAYYFPDVDKKYYKDYESYLVVEMFADEFAYKRFGKLYIKASEKAAKFASKEGREQVETRLKDLEEMALYRKNKKQPYWLAYAKSLGVKVKYNPENSMVVGIRPSKRVLKGLY